MFIELIIVFWHYYYWNIYKSNLCFVLLCVIGKLYYPYPHWGRVTHKCVSTLTIIGSDNGLSPGRRQSIIWTNAGILLIEPLETKFNEIVIEIYAFSFKKMHLEMSSGKWRPFCLGPNVLRLLHTHWYNHAIAPVTWIQIYVVLVK